MTSESPADRLSKTTMLRPIAEVDPNTPGWAGAVWIGQIDSADHVISPVVLQHGALFDRARLLVWERDRPRGFVELPLTDGTLDPDGLTKAIASLPDASPRPTQPLPPISVVVCTFDRPELLRRALNSLTNQRYPDFEIVVVDNNPPSGLTEPVVLDIRCDRVRVVEAPFAGLSFARNVGLLAARHDYVAFTDDDVIIDVRWLESLAGGFGAAPNVACVSGMVPSAEVLSPAQAYFDRRVGWASRCDFSIYHLADPPAGDRLFPLRVARFGTGANFAVDRRAVIELGGFDEGLGVGSPGGGAEDIDMFLRILLAGYSLVYEPAAVVWHRHRRDLAGLTVQLHNYGIGLGAWIAKLVVHRRTLAMVLRRVLPAILHLRSVTMVEADELLDANPQLAQLYVTERKGVALGPIALTRSRRAGRKPKPFARLASRESLQSYVSRKR